MLKLRRYGGLHDLDRMKRLLIEILSGKPHSTYHPGDLDWRLFVVSAGYPTEDILRLWENDRHQTVGWMFVYPAAGMIDLVIHPDLSGTPAEAQMLEDVEQHLAGLNIAVNDHLKMFVFADDMPRRNLLESSGYTGTDCRVHLAQPLTDRELEPHLPAGFRFLSVQGHDFAERRAELHVDAFAPGSTMTAEKYHAVMQAPNYDPEMDVVVVAPDGQFAAFALTWIEPITRIGLFEPVGTRTTFQRLGLGKAALMEAMRRMKARGVETATVRTTRSLRGVMPFYQAAGFHQMNSIYCYEPFVVGKRNTEMADRDWAR
jgi:GNAT superfamily N-acetyltransferase